MSGSPLIRSTFLFLPFFLLLPHLRLNWPWSQGRWSPSPGSSEQLCSVQLLTVGLHRITEELGLGGTFKGHLVQPLTIIFAFELRALAQAFHSQVLPFQLFQLHPLLFPAVPG